MGSRFGRQKTDPFYNARPPSGGSYLPPLQANTATLLTSDPFIGYNFTATTVPSIEIYYRTRQRPVTPNNYGGRYVQGFNQAPGVGPWSYGNYYLGNTMMQMMPSPFNQCQQFPSMLANPAPSSACAMAAAATPLPVAFNPLVQGMYPMASMSPVNWMAPSSFMSALMSGPMPYRPPAYEFPNNVNMVMAVPYGTPNPLVSTPSSSGGSCYYSNYSPTAPTPIQATACSESVYNNKRFTNDVSKYNDTRVTQRPKRSAQKPTIKSNNKHEVRDREDYFMAKTPKFGFMSDNDRSTVTDDSYSNDEVRYFSSSDSFPRPILLNQRSEPMIPPITYGTVISDSGWLSQRIGRDKRNTLYQSLHVTTDGRSMPHSNTNESLGRLISNLADDCKICQDDWWKDHSSKNHYRRGHFD